MKLNTSWCDVSLVRNVHINSKDKNKATFIVVVQYF